MVLFRQTFEKILAAAGSARAEFHGVDAGAAVEAADAGQFRGGKLGVLGMGVVAFAGRVVSRGPV